MSIDPRMMTQLLQLQLSRTGLDLTGGTEDSAAGNDTSDVFAGLLQSLLGQDQPQAPSSRVIPAEVLMRMTRSYSPVQQLAMGNYDSSEPSKYETLIQSAASRYGVDPSLIRAVIKQESDFDPSSVSVAGAKGLMQLMDDTARGYGVTNSFDPVQNIDAGTQFLSGLLRKYNGNEAMALAAYNAGPGRVGRLGVTNDQQLLDKLGQLPKETQGYVRKVLAYKQQFGEA